MIPFAPPTAASGFWDQRSPREEGPTPGVDAVARKWSSRGGAKNSGDASPEAKELYNIARDLERRLHEAQKERDWRLEQATYNWNEMIAARRERDAALLEAEERRAAALEEAAFEAESRISSSMMGLRAQIGYFIRALAEKGKP